MIDEPQPAGTGTLSFSDEPGSARSKWVAGLLVLALLGWMGSGYILPAPPEEAPHAAPEVAAVAVTVRNSEAETVTQTFTAEGQAEPDRRTAMRAEVSGSVAELVAEKGDWLEQGEVIARLDRRELEAQLRQAEEELARAQRNFDNAQTLLERGVATTDRVTEARAALATAEAQVTQAEEALENAAIRAPFAGRLDALGIDEGEVVSAGAEVGIVLDSDPLTVVVQVPQQMLSRLDEGLPAQVSFITGEEREGEVAFIGADADAQTRTFRVEVSVPNPQGELASGLSARVRIPTGQMRAHFVSPAILSLGADGALGVKTVTEDDTVEFHEIAIERAQTDGVWVSGLPETVRLITIGQGYVRDGETVEPSPETGGSEAPDDGPPRAAMIKVEQ